MEEKGKGRKRRRFTAEYKAEAVLEKPLQKLGSIRIEEMAIVVNFAARRCSPTVPAGAAVPGSSAASSHLLMAARRIHVATNGLRDQRNP
jgi:hypothetical protein